MVFDTKPLVVDCMQLRDVPTKLGYVGLERLSEEAQS